MQQKKSMTVSNNTMQAEGIGSVFKNLWRGSAKTGKKLATNVLKSQAVCWKILQTLLPQLQLEILKMFYQDHVKLKIFMTREEGFT